jgi:hypothetical protein
MEVIPFSYMISVCWFDFCLIANLVASFLPWSLPFYQ